MGWGIASWHGELACNPRILLEILLHQVQDTLTSVWKESQTTNTETEVPREESTVVGLSRDVPKDPLGSD